MSPAASSLSFVDGSALLTVEEMHDDQLGWHGRPSSSIHEGGLTAQVLSGLLTMLLNVTLHRLFIMFASEQSEVFQLTSIQSFSGF
jgi:hypothetical protein